MRRASAGPNRVPSPVLRSTIESSFSRTCLPGSMSASGVATPVQASITSQQQPPVIPINVPVPVPMPIHGQPGMGFPTMAHQGAMPYYFPQHQPNGGGQQHAGAAAAAAVAAVAAATAAAPCAQSTYENKDHEDLPPKS